MCKVIAVLNNDEKNTPVINQILKANSVSLATQKDGYSVYRKGKGSKFYVNEKDYFIPHVQKNIQYTGEALYMTHFRLSTCGDEGKDGCHLQHINHRYIFAHNGTVSAFNSAKRKNDSYHFFNRLLQKNKKINTEILNGASQMYGFSGKGFLYDEKNDIFHIFMNQLAYIYILKDALIFSTWKLDLEYDKVKYHSTLGFQWEEKIGTEKIEGILYDENIDNLYMKFVKNKLILQDYFKNTTYYYNNSYSGGYAKPYSPNNSSKSSFNKKKKKKRTNQIDIHDIEDINQTKILDAWGKSIHTLTDEEWNTLYSSN